MLPHWDKMKDIDRALCRMHDPDAEQIFRLTTDGKCRFLLQKADGKTECMIYNNPNRPKFCSLFPNEKSQIRNIPTCSVRL